MLHYPVKASKISNLTDARYFAAWYVDWLGFDLRMANLPDFPLAKVKEMKDWIEGPKIIGEVGSLSLSEVEQLLDFLALEHVQVGQFTAKKLLEGLSVKTRVQEVVIEPMMKQPDLLRHLDDYFNYVDAFLLDFSSNQIAFAEQGISRSELAEVCRRYPVWLDANLPADKLSSFLEEVRPEVIVMQGGMEEKVGYKSFDELDELLEALTEES